MRNWAKFSDFILTFLYVIGHCIVEVSVQFTNQRWGSMEIPTRKCHTSALFLFLFSSLIYLSLISLYCFSLSASLWLAFQYHATVALCITMSQELRKKKKKKWGSDLGIVFVMSHIEASKFLRHQLMNKRKKSHATWEHLEPSLGILFF